MKAGAKKSNAKKGKGKAKESGGEEGDKGKVHVDNRRWTLPKQEQYLSGRLEAYKEA